MINLKVKSAQTNRSALFAILHGAKKAKSTQKNSKINSNKSLCGYLFVVDAVLLTLWGCEF